jgi:hypothetical protein
MNPELLVENVDATLARSLLVDRFGPQCAAWLLGAPWHEGGISRRTAFRRRLYTLVVEVPEVDRSGAAYEMPMWFSLAIDCLAKRDGWSVVTVRQLGKRFVRISWHNGRRPLPISALS